MKVLILSIVLGVFATPASTQSLQVIGYSGYLGEWELTANLVENAPEEGRRYSGPVKLTHVGICSQDGAEEKMGEMHLELSNASARLDATLIIAGVTCTYSGRLSDFYSGKMTCPDRESAPLKLWVK